MAMNPCIRVRLAVIFLLYCLSSKALSQSTSSIDPGIVVTPDSDQTVPFASDENITYTCTVDGGRTAVWEVRGRQILGQEQASVFAENGIFVEGLNSNTSVIIVSGEARRNASQNSPPGVYLHCVALERLKGTAGRQYSIITYTPPVSPHGLTLEISSAPSPTLSLVWQRPFNVVQRVAITYRVEIVSTVENGTNYGPFENLTQTSFPIDFPEALHSNKSCQMYQFKVTAISGAGNSTPAEYFETLPITTDVSNISQTLSVSDIDFRNGQGIALTVRFESLRSCSENFPIRNYTIQLDNATSTYTLLPQQFPQPGEDFSQEVDNADFPELLLDATYSVSVMACSDFSCKQSTFFRFYTTDLQSAEVVFYENNVFLRCILAQNSPARGCFIRLRLGTMNNTQSDDTFELQRESSMTGSRNSFMLTNCTMSTNQRAAYSEIVGVDLEADGSLGEIEILVTVVTADSGEGFTSLTPCTLPTLSTPDNRSLAIALPIVFVLLLAAGITIVVVFVIIYLKQHRTLKKRPTIETDHIEEEDSIVCEVKFKGDEFTNLLQRPVKRSTSAPVNILNHVRSPSSSESSSHTDNVSGADRVASDSGQKPPYLRSVSDNYQMNTYEVELGKRLFRLKLHRQGLRQYGRRSLSEGGSTIGSSGMGAEGGSGVTGGGGGGEVYPRVPSRLKISEELQRLLCDNNLHEVPEESEPGSPNLDSADGERHSLIVTENTAVNKKKMGSPSLSQRSGITCNPKEEEIDGL